MSVIKRYAPEIFQGKLTHAAPGVAYSAGAEIVGSPLDYGIGIGRVAHFKYDFSLDGGVIGLVTIKTTAQLPINAILLDGMLKAVVAPVGASATIAFGTSAGSSASSILGATAITSFTLGTLVDIVPVGTAATAVKMSAAGNITMTIATTALTAGIVEGWVRYFVANG